MTAPGPGAYDPKIPTKPRIHMARERRFKNSISFGLGPGSYFQEDIKEKVLARYTPIKAHVYLHFKKHLN